MITFVNKPLNGNKIIFSAKENDNFIGSCTIRLTECDVEILSAEIIIGEEYIFDGLIKSAMNYAANRNYFMCFCSNENLFFRLKTMGFYETKKGLENDIPSILIGKCSECIK